jgi:N-acetylneuraminate lyase
MTFHLTGLVAATHTPFHSDGRLNVGAVEKQAEHLHRNGVKTVFIGGTTGESHSLTVDERLCLAERWSEVVRGSGIHMVVHVGANCLADARIFSAQAHRLNVAAIAALCPSYFKPTSVQILVNCCLEIATAAPHIPFYYYDIPSLTGVHLSMPEFVKIASERIRTFAGLKFTNPDLIAYQALLHGWRDRFDFAWGVDEYLLPALAFGAVGAVGSSYNFTAPLFHRLIAAFSRGDLGAARAEQQHATQLIEMLGRFGYIAAAKAVMGWLGVDVGPARLPNKNLSDDEQKALRTDLEKLGFFDWIRV